MGSKPRCYQNFTYPVGLELLKGEPNDALVALNDELLPEKRGYQLDMLTRYFIKKISHILNINNSK